jgi:hypothetical protein
LTRISAFGAACSAALAVAACGGGSGSVNKASSSSTGGSLPSVASSSTSSPQPSFDPAAGPVVAATQLPKNCNGLVTDADMQLALGNPLNGGDYFTSYQPDAGHKQTGRVKCQYGVIQDSTGKVTGNQVEVQLATYADPASAQSRAAATVGTLAGAGAQYGQVSVNGHPATYVTEAGKDAVLVMYDGNRTFLITTQEALVKGEDAKAFTLKIADALYKHTTPNTPASPTGAPSGATPATNASSSAPSGSAPASGSSVPAGTPASGGSAPPSSAASD